MSDDKGKFTLLFSSPHSFGKADRAAKELAERASKYTDIEILVSPVPDLAALRAEVEGLKAERDTAQKEARRWTILVHDIEAENRMLREANLGGRRAFLRQVDVASRAWAKRWKAAAKSRRLDARGYHGKWTELLRLVREWLAFKDKVENDSDTTNMHDGTYDMYYMAEARLAAAVRGDTEGKGEHAKS